MKKIYIPFLFLALACGNNKQPVVPPVKTDTIKTVSADTVRYGNHLKIQVVQTFNDSVIMDSRQAPEPTYISYDSTALTPEDMKTFRGAKEGDEIIIKKPVDETMKANGPAYIQKGGDIVIKIKIEKIFRSQYAFEEYRKANTPAN